MKKVHLNALDLNLLRVFDALHEERSVTRAGARLGLTQSAISHALNRLRHLFADELFIRSVDGMQPTAHAAEIGPRVRNALLQLQLAVTATEFDPKSTERRFTIGANEFTSTVVLPALIKRLGVQAPHARLRVRPIIDIDIVEELDAGRIDIIIGSFGRIPQRFAEEALFDDQGVWVLREDHPLTRRPLSAERIAEFSHSVLAVTTATPESVDGYTIRHGLERRTIIAQALAQQIKIGLHGNITLPHLLAVPNILAHSDLIAFLPRRIATIFAATHPLALLDPPQALEPFKIMALWHARLGARSDVAWLRSVLRDVAAGLPPLPPPRRRAKAGAKVSARQRAKA
jgi:DNA-binding transcriptional LysR family regulator